MGSVAVDCLEAGSQLSVGYIHSKESSRINPNSECPLCRRLSERLFKLTANVSYSSASMDGYIGPLII